jgi:hypothetical protein
MTITRFARKVSRMRKVFFTVFCPSYLMALSYYTIIVSKKRECRLCGTGEERKEVNVPMFSTIYFSFSTNNSFTMEKEISRKIIRTGQAANRWRHCSYSRWLRSLQKNSSILMQHVTWKGAGLQNLQRELGKRFARTKRSIELPITP